MSLFEINEQEVIRVISKEGIVDYYGMILTKVQADKYLQCLLQDIAWKNDEAVIFGKRVVTKRKVAWYGDHDFEYTYSNITKKALPWSPELLELKSIVETTCAETFNSCLLNLYHNGDEGMAWHSDAEKDLKKDGAIASLSLGAARKFSFKHKKTKETVSAVLAHGSLLVMKGATQTNWLHRLPPTKLVAAPRVNLTFRTIVH